MYDDIVAFMLRYEKADYTTVKTNLRRVRKLKGLTPKYFEKKIGVPAKQYGQFEKLSYAHKPSIETLIKVCYAMDSELDELLVPLK